MTWREQVTRLEDEGNFDIAVFLLEKVIKENPNEMDAYIFLLYRFMDSSLENTCYWSNVSKDPLSKIKEEYCKSKIWSDYKVRAQKCFDESYRRFSDNPEYLYYASRFLMLCAGFLGLNIEESLLDEMYQKAKDAGYNKYLDERHPSDVNDVAWALRTKHDLSLQEQLATKGAAGKYIVGGVLSWAAKILAEAGQEQEAKD